MILLSFFLRPADQPELQQQHDAEQRGDDAHADEGPTDAARHETEQQQHRRAEHDRPQVLIDQVMRGGRLVQRVDLTQQDHAGAGGAGQHSEEREEGLVGIVREQLAANPVIVEVGREGSDHAQEDQRDPELLVAESGKIDRRDRGHDHDIEHRAGDAVEHEVVDILPFDDALLFSLLQAGADKNGKYKGGQVKKIDNKTFDKYYAQYQSRQINKVQFAKALNISRPTLDKLLKEKYQQEVSK